MSNINKAQVNGTNRTKSTISFWVKKCITADQKIFQFKNGSAEYLMKFKSNDQIHLYSYNGSSYIGRIETNQVFRDLSSWYHFHIQVDTTDATAGNRFRFYVNGEQVTSLLNSTTPSQNDNFEVSTSSHHLYIGSQADGGDAFAGIFAHFHYTDGYSYGPDTFGQTDTTSGIWIPKTAPSVTYGTNGFFLKFENSANMDLDSSGNNLTFTTTGTITQNVDTPTNVFPSWNPSMNNAEGGSWSNANLTIAPDGDATYLYAPITMPLSKGKWYSEHMITSGNGYGSIGFAGASKISDIFRTGNEPGNATPSFAFRCTNGGIKMNDSNTTYGSAPGTSDAILGIAVDIDNKKVWYSINGTYVTYGGGVGDPAGGNYGFDWSSLSDDFGWLMICGDSENNGYGNWKSNFGSGFFGTTAVASANADANGHGAFEYTVPSGYYSICTKNIKEFG